MAAFEPQPGCSKDMQDEVMETISIASSSSSTTTEAAPSTSPGAVQSLLSFEKLDRSSPEMWPEAIPGVTEFVSEELLRAPPPPWRTGLTTDDLREIARLGSLSKTNLIAEVKQLFDQAYQLGREEAREITRGKYLDIFEARKKK